MPYHGIVLAKLPSYHVLNAKCAPLLQKYFLALLILAQKTNSSSHNTSPAGDPIHVTRQSDAAQLRHITLQRHTAVESAADDPVTAEMLEVVLSGR